MLARCALLTAFWKYCNIFLQGWYRWWPRFFALWCWYWRGGMAQKWVVFQKTWESHLGRAGALRPAELQGCGVTGVTQRAAEQSPGPPSHRSCRHGALERAQKVGTWAVLVVLKTKLSLSLHCYFYPFIFNANIFHSDFFQMGSNIFPSSAAYGSWAPQAVALCRNASTAQFTCSGLGGFLAVTQHHGEKPRAIKCLTKCLQAPMLFCLTFCLFFPDLSKAIPRKREQIPCC